jgi:hypothetical protein
LKDKLKEEPLFFFADVSFRKKMGHCIDSKRMKIWNSFLITFLLTGCDRDDINPCNEQPEDIWSRKLGILSKYFECSLLNVDPTSEKVNISIQTLEQFKNLTSCGSDLGIEFNYYTVLAGRLRTPGGGRVLNQWVAKECGEYHFHVQVGWAVGNDLKDVFYFALMSKIPQSENVIYDIEVLPCNGDTSEPKLIASSTFDPNAYYFRFDSQINDVEAKFVVINSQSDYAKYLLPAQSNGMPQPSIDFSAQTILIGEVVGSSSSRASNNFVYKKCDQFFYLAEISPGGTTDVAWYSFYIIAPKIPEKADVFFDYRYIY